MSNSKKSPPETCRQCGTCCKKGGPAFHLEDRRLIDNGLVPAADLYTIRKDEPAYENIRKHLVSVETDIIKIKGKPGRWECLYFESRSRNCGIYENRPEECRALACGDTSAIKDVAASAHLTRADLLSGVQGIWDLIEDHQNRCGYWEILKLKGRINTHSDNAARTRLREMVAYDRQIRQTLVKNSIAPGMMDFLFGRPLSDTLPALGIQTY